MLIDHFKEDFFDALSMRAVEPSTSKGLYLLIDGAFVPGLHKTLATEVKSLLFASLPRCNNETANLSPFLMPYAIPDKRVRSLLQRCDGWPMVSMIETPEPLAQLSKRLSAWCVVEVDGQRFNFRFPDTRRLPTIFRTLDPAQRAQFTGPIARWSYVGRDGCWNELEVSGSREEPATNPVLNNRQFAALVDDSRADELLVLLGDRGYEVGKHPSVSHARVSAALRVAVSAVLDDNDVLPWCAWYWQHAEMRHDCSAETAFQTWRDTSLMEK
ncbi:DUF4123 domain-containing protein [Massilia niabensis]|uniref:DUF4123 domain-containing protein n=1 Tax=Massilia niabensis TaxID=544910 RepID=A0ABW0L720_9BURK